jgi:DtxR family transcriptional regulator, Mn-dependent transcriptional regulator
VLTGNDPSIRRALKLSSAQEDYLKSLEQAGAGESAVSTSELSARLGVSPASVAEMLGRLAGMGLVVHDRYRGAKLTPTGRMVALEMIRHHRLLEVYLAEALGYAWDEVHEEAERLEHVISERMEERIYHLLGRPDVDPHGDPIPSRSGDFEARPHRPLTEALRGQHLAVRRVSDREPGKLRELARLGLRLGATLDVVRESQYEGPITVRLAGRPRSVPVPLGLARAVYVEEVGV